jgi:gluconate 5-dehydrogenase
MTHQLFDISGRTALVTGGSRGIGYALAEGLVAAGCHVVINGRDETALGAAAARLAAQEAGQVHTAPFDVTDADAVTTRVAEVAEQVGPLDILVNNAGIQHRSPLLDFPRDAWHQIMNVHVTGAFLVGRAAARQMIPRGHGKIVNVCSLNSELARQGIAPYTAAKGALKMLTKGMCADWGPSGVQVNGLAPGYIETELNRALLTDDEFSAWVRRRTPAGRWGQVEDLVGALLFLVSPASDFVNGQVLYVDGGMSSVL